MYKRDMKIAFNPDEQIGGALTPDQRKQYIALCEQITSRDDSIDGMAISNEILAIMKDVALSISNESLHSQIEEFYNSIDFSDTNHIGKINIFGLQCILLFNISLEVSSSSSNAYEYYMLTTSDAWKQYATLKKMLRNFKFLNVLYPHTRRYIHLICVVDELKIDELISSFVNNTFYCGFSANYLYADGRYLSPFDFMCHDIDHGYVYTHTCVGKIPGSMMHNPIHLKSFYEFIKTSAKPNPEKYAAKWVFYINVHESLCDLFYFSKPPNGFVNESRLINNLNSAMERFLDPNDLWVSIPKRYRSDVDKKKQETIQEFIKYAVQQYIHFFTEWYNSLTKEVNASANGTANGIISSINATGVPTVSTSCKNGKCAIMGGSRRKRRTYKRRLHSKKTRTKTRK
jgi:hypothetical protein